MQSLDAASSNMSARSADGLPASPPRTDLRESAQTPSAVSTSSRARVATSTRQSVDAIARMQPSSRSSDSASIAASVRASRGRGQQRAVPFRDRCESRVRSLDAELARRARCRCDRARAHRVATARQSARATMHPAETKKARRWRAFRDSRRMPAINLLRCRAVRRKRPDRAGFPYLPADCSDARRESSRRRKRLR